MHWSFRISHSSAPRPSSTCSLNLIKFQKLAVVAGSVNPHYINPQQGLDRLQKLMDEYCGGYTVGYMTNENLLSIGLKKLKLMEEDLESLAAKDLHELLRA